MRKPFLTITEQVELLNSRGVATDEETEGILLSEGYYSVVNGYKAPFIDAEATAEAGDDRYKEKTHFNDIHALFVFDRELRELTFHYLVRIETLLKSVCAHRFSEVHRSANAYLDPSSYATESEYIVHGGDYHRNLARLLAILRTMAEDRHNLHPYIDHYRDHVGHVPLWVLSNALTFGNVEHLFDLMRSAEQAVVCRDIAELTGHLGDERLGYFHPRRARVCIESMVKYRNLCVHDERLYCARVGRRTQIDFRGLMERMLPFISQKDYSEFLKGLTALLRQYSEEGKAAGHVIEKMGLTEWADKTLPNT